MGKRGQCQSHTSDQARDPYVKGIYQGGGIFDKRFSSSWPPLQITADEIPIRKILFIFLFSVFNQCIDQLREREKDFLVLRGTDSAPPDLVLCHSTESLD